MSADCLTCICGFDIVPKAHAEALVSAECLAYYKAPAEALVSAEYLKARMSQAHARGFVSAENVG